MAYVKLHEVISIIEEVNNNYAGLIQHILEHCHVVDVKEEKHGYWDYYQINGKTYCRCSECGESPECFEPHYCPYCGSTMDRKGSYNG